MSLEWRLADGTPVGEPLRVDTAPMWAMAVSALPDGTPVIVSGGYDHTVRVSRLPYGSLVRKRVHGKEVSGVAAGAMPVDAPVIDTGGHGTMRVSRLADGTLVVPRLGLPGAYPCLCGLSSFAATSSSLLPRTISLFTS